MDAEPQLRIIDVRINGQMMEATRPVLRRGTRILFETSELAAWQLVVPAAPGESLNGNAYHDLLALPGVRIGLDEASQTVNLDVPPEGFLGGLAKSRPSARMPVSESVFGAFLNYDAVLQTDQRGSTASGYFDAAVSTQWGLGVASFVAGQAALGGASPAIRLDTYYRFDDPNALTRLTLGDAIVRSAVWSTPFRYGGVQFGTQFGLQPGYISYPTPTLHGSSGLPSAIEVYVNDTLRYQGRAEAGPFAVPNIPVLTGAGEMRFAVTDALGVQRTVTTPYYVSSNLLRSGLSDYSLELGWNRLYYGERSLDYGAPFGAGTWRKGLDDRATVEFHGEFAMARQTAGGGLTWVMEPLGEFAVHAAASRDLHAQLGHLLRTSFVRSSAEWTFAANRQTSSHDFTQLGAQDSPTPIGRQDQVFAGRSFGRYGSLGSSFTRLRYNQSGDSVAVLSANWSLTLSGGGSLSAYVARTRQSASTPVTSIGLTFTMALGNQHTGAVSMQSLAGRTTTTAEVDRTAPVGIEGGYGYRVLASQGETARAAASLNGLNRYGSASAEAATLNGDTALRLRASGAVGSAGGLLFAARQSDDAFALVTVPGAAGLNVYRENQHLATTDDQGCAIVPGLRAYELNRISLTSSPA